MTLEAALPPIRKKILERKHSLQQCSTPGVEEFKLLQFPVLKILISMVWHLDS